MTTMKRNKALECLYEECKRRVVDRPAYPQLWLIQVVTPLVEAVDMSALDDGQLAEERLRRELADARTSLNHITERRQGLDAEEERAKERIAAAEKLLAANTLAEAHAAGATEEVGHE